MCTYVHVLCVPTQSVCMYMYSCMYSCTVCICTHVLSHKLVCVCVFSGVLIPAACTSGFSQYSDGEGTMTKYSDLMRGRCVCGMIVV